ncbi:unnamed protein product [Paramecium sonneborni]|uniref:Uncharacterized protein n=1 Tax=Paramecium sonneborni TaxID=65129 RepID=A0A8S1KWQ2_9CILI|nr:unnamed protein product [Paramecium sonneborni]
MNIHNKSMEMEYFMQVQLQEEQHQFISLYNVFDLFQDGKFGQRELNSLSYKEWQIQMNDKQKVKKLVWLMIYKQFGY